MTIKIINLWPTKLVKKMLPKFEEPNRGLLKLIRGWDRSSKNLTTDYHHNNPFEIDSPATNWLGNHVNQTIGEYLRAIRINYSVNWQLHGWTNVNRNGDYHDPHNHTHCYLSGTYYVKVPSKGSKHRQRSDVRPNCITFYDPRTGFSMQSIAHDPYIFSEYTVKPSPGLLMLWPPSLMHFVHPNLSNETRVSIGFNIILEWSDNYLPEKQ